MNAEQTIRNIIVEDARSANCRPEKQFVKWYAGFRKESAAAECFITDGGDGEIDLVIQQNFSVVLAQIKYRKASQHDLRAFSNTIEAWSKPDTFNSWVENQVTKTAARQKFKEIYSIVSKNNKTLYWDFVSLSPHNEAWEKQIHDKVRYVKPRAHANVFSSDHLLYFFELESIGARYIDSLEFKAPPNHLAVVHNAGIETHLFALPINDFLAGLRLHSNPDAMLARNVRLEIPNSPVNAGILHTYSASPEKFFFGNGGVHIVATEKSSVGNKVALHQPSIINGGQTIKTLLSATRVSHRKGEILVRVSIIPHDFQSTEKGRNFVGDIIFMSNSNNKMEAWNLRSNDPEQVMIAKHFYRANVYYERKDGEWAQNKDNIANENINDYLHSTELASAIACANDSINPVGLKTAGISSLFMRKSGLKKENAYYEEVFGRTEKRLDEFLSMARLYLVIGKFTGKVPGIQKDFKSFPRSAKHFIYGVVWRAIEDKHLTHPFCMTRPYTTSCKRLRKVVVRLAKEIFAEFEVDLKDNHIQLNDLFRGREYWDRALRKFLTKQWRQEIAAALTADLKECNGHR